ncbi:hypothetical protein [Pedobacter sp. ASV12]|uniref:hypothetical protein n=1 Tax=Pedobacter sp. ASV12 TaxID=2795120 RepID=UPI0018EBA481|nr:hypothetical protein [Pedobacter sp. ASV12]
MTEKFPKLKEGQVALLVADRNTGIVLNENFNYATDASQKVYRIFENTDEALKYAKSLIFERNSVECYINESENKLLYFLDIENVNTF